MPADFSDFTVQDGELLDPDKQDNFLAKLVEILNNMGDLDKMGWAPGQILLPSQLLQQGATNGQVLAYNTTSGLWEPTDASGGGGGSAPFIVHHSVTPVELANTTVETDLIGDPITIDADSMGTDKRLRLSALGTFKDNTSTRTYPRLKLVFGSAVVLDTGPGTYNGNNQTGLAGGWRIDAEIQNLTNGTQFCYLKWSILDMAAVASAFAVGDGGLIASGIRIGLFAEGTAEASVDTTIDCALKLRCTNATASANYVTKCYSACAAIE